MPYFDLIFGIFVIKFDIKITGHFVVLCGYDDEKNHIIIADPLKHYFANTNYGVKVWHLINAIMLGILTYDANLLIIQPKNSLERAIL